MTDISYETKLLFSHVKKNEEKYENDEMDINDILKKTDELYVGLSQAKQKPPANVYLHDVELLTLETKIVRQSARSYRLHSLSFEPKKFSAETRNFFGMGNLDENTQAPHQDCLPMLWIRLGEYSKEVMNIVPNFDFIYGTFDADPIERVLKKRKQTIKDKIGELTKPKEVDISEAITSQDIMCNDAAKILTCFIKLTQKCEKEAVCFYEFVIDPTSFTRTVEYIFLVSLLVQHGELCVFADDQGLPWIKKVQSKDSDASQTAFQTALSLSMDEWKSLIKTFKIITPVIPARTLGT